MNKDDGAAALRMFSWVVPGFIALLAFTLRRHEPPTLYQGLVVFGMTVPLWSLALAIRAALPARRCRICQGRLRATDAIKRGTICGTCIEAPDLAVRSRPSRTSIGPARFLFGGLLGAYVGAVLSMGNGGPGAPVFLPDPGLLDASSFLLMLLGGGVLLSQKVREFSRARAEHRQAAEDAAAGDDLDARDDGRPEKCLVCGRSFLPPGVDSSREVCPVCTETRATGKEAVPKPGSPAGKPASPGLWMFLIVVIATIAYLMKPEAPRPGVPPPGQTEPMMHVVIVPAFVALMFLVVLGAAWVVKRRYHRQEGLLGTIRKVGVRGKMRRLGRRFVWWSGREDPTDRVEAECDAVFVAMERVLGRKVDPEVRPVFYAFATRDEFQAVLREIVKSTIDEAAVSITTSPGAVLYFVDGAPADVRPPEVSVRRIVADVLLRGGPGDKTPPAWIWNGLLTTVVETSLGDPLRDDLRALKLDLDRGDWLRDDEFEKAAPDQVGRWILCGRDPAIAAKSRRFARQSSATIAYLRDGGRAQKFQAFLADLNATGTQQSSFRRHFGFGFRRLRSEVEAYVRALPQIEPKPAPAPIRSRLDAFVVPLIVDRNAPVEDREQALRSWADAGFVDRADVLVYLLETDPTLRRSELVAVLEEISGRSYGEDPAAWREWSRSLPSWALG